MNLSSYNGNGNSKHNYYTQWYKYDDNEYGLWIMDYMYAILEYDYYETFDFVNTKTKREHG